VHKKAKATAITLQPAPYCALCLAMSFPKCPFWNALRHGDALRGTASGTAMAMTAMSNANAHIGTCHFGLSR
jgi:hypothetical protein